MLLQRGFAQFQHISKKKNLLFKPHLSKVLYRGAHTCRVGIVGIHNKSAVLALYHLGAVIGWPVLSYCICSLRERNTKIGSHTERSQHIICIIRAYEPALYSNSLILCLALRRTWIEHCLLRITVERIWNGEPQCWILQRAGKNLRPVIYNPVRHIVQLLPLCKHLRNIWVIHIYKGYAAVGKKVVQKFSLCLHNTL